MPPSRTPQVLFQQGMTSKKSFFPNSMMFIGSQECQSSIYSFCTELLRFGRHVMKGLRAFVCAVAFSLPLARGQCYPVPTSNGLVYTCTSYSSQMGNPRFDMEPWNALERLVAIGCVWEQVLFHVEVMASSLLVCREWPSNLLKGYSRSDAFGVMFLSSGV